MHCTKFSGNNAKNIQQYVETNVNVVFFHVPIFMRNFSGFSEQADFIFK